MAVKLNKTAFNHAKELINEGKVVLDDRDAWSEYQPSAEEENEFVLRHGFEEYGKWHLGIDDEASENTTKPSMNIRRRPSRSAMRPPSRRNPPKVSTYAFTTQARFSWEKSSPSPIEGRATFTIDASRTTMNCAKHSSAACR